MHCAVNGYCIAIAINAWCDELINHLQLPHLFVSSMLIVFYSAEKKITRTPIKSRIPQLQNLSLPLSGGLNIHCYQVCITIVIWFFKQLEQSQSGSPFVLWLITTWTNDIALVHSDVFIINSKVIALVIRSLVIWFISSLFDLSKCSLPPWPWP